MIAISGDFGAIEANKDGREQSKISAAPVWSLDWIFVSAPEMAPNFSRGVKSRKQDYVSRVLELESRFGGLSWTESHLSKQGVLATF